MAESVEEGLTEMLASNRDHAEKLRLSLEFIALPNDRHKFAEQLAKRAHGAHATDPRAVKVVNTLRQYLNGSKTLEELQADAAEAWDAFREFEFSDPPRAMACNICASAASFYDGWAAIAYAAWDLTPEKQKQCDDLTILVNHGSLPP